MPNHTMSHQQIQTLKINRLIILQDKTNSKISQIRIRNQMIWHFCLKDDLNYKMIIKIVDFLNVDQPYLMNFI